MNIWEVDSSKNTTLVWRNDDAIGICPRVSVNLVSPPDADAKQSTRSSLHLSFTFFSHSHSCIIIFFNFFLSHTVSSFTIKHNWSSRLERQISTRSFNLTIFYFFFSNYFRSYSLSLSLAAFLSFPFLTSRLMLI